MKRHSVPDRTKLLKEAEEPFVSSSSIFSIDSIRAGSMGDNCDVNCCFTSPSISSKEVAGMELGQTASTCHDDDGRLKRTGTVLTASAHIITAVIGSGVLSLAWAIGQLGWVAGPFVMILFSFVIYYTSTLLSCCYRSGDPVSGKRNYTYMDAVRSNLGN